MRHDNVIKKIQIYLIPWNSPLYMLTVDLEWLGVICATNPAEVNGGYFQDIKV